MVKKVTLSGDCGGGRGGVLEAQIGSCLPKEDSPGSCPGKYELPCNEQITLWERTAVVGTQSRKCVLRDVFLGNRPGLAPGDEGAHPLPQHQDHPTAEDRKPGPCQSSTQVPFFGDPPQICSLLSEHP